MSANTVDQSDEGEGVDQYGNDLNGDTLKYCCFPDCGCDGARLCQAERGASFCAQTLNIERGSAAASIGRSMPATEAGGVE